jgi:hypothetical protein
MKNLILVLFILVNSFSMDIHSSIKDKSLSNKVKQLLEDLNDYGYNKIVAITTLRAYSSSILSQNDKRFIFDKFRKLSVYNSIFFKKNSNTIAMDFEQLPNGKFYIVELYFIDNKSFRVGYNEREINSLNSFKQFINISNKGLYKPISDFWDSQSVNQPTPEPEIEQKEYMQADSKQNLSTNATNKEYLKLKKGKTVKLRDVYGNVILHTVTSDDIIVLEDNKIHDIGQSFDTYKVTVIGFQDKEYQGFITAVSAYYEN